MTRNKKSKRIRASLVVPWIRIHQPVQETRFDPWSRKIPHAILVFLPEKFCGQEEPGGLYSSCGCKESDMTEQLNTHTTIVRSRWPPCSGSLQTTTKTLADVFPAPMRLATIHKP